MYVEKFDALNHKYKVPTCPKDQVIWRKFVGLDRRLFALHILLGSGIQIINIFPELPSISSKIAEECIRAETN